MCRIYGCNDRRAGLPMCVWGCTLGLGCVCQSTGLTCAYWQTGTNELVLGAQWLVLLISRFEACEGAVRHQMDHPRVQSPRSKYQARSSLPRQHKLGQATYSLQS